MKHEYILFDLDNTIMDFHDAEHKAFFLTLNDFNLSGDEELYKKYHIINDGYWKQYEKGVYTRPQIAVNRFKDLLKLINSDIEPEKFNLAYINNLKKGDKEIDGATSTLKTLSEMGATLYIATNGITEVQKERLKNKEFMKYIKCVFVSEKLGTPKPNKEFFERASKECYFPLDSRTLIVGDSLSSDIKGGINANLSTCWLNSNGATNAENLPITYTITSLSQVVDIIK